MTDSRKMMGFYLHVIATGQRAGLDPHGSQQPKTTILLRHIQE